MANPCHSPPTLVVRWFVVLTLSVFAISSQPFPPWGSTLPMPWLCQPSVAPHPHPSVISKLRLVYGGVFNLLENGVMFFIWASNVFLGKRSEEHTSELQSPTD